MELSKARELAETIISKLELSTKRPVIAGSIRRGKESVKDIEIVAIPDDWNKMFSTLEEFGQFIKPGTPDIIPWPPKKEAKYLRLFLKEKIKLDLFLARENNYGGVLMLRTGSAMDQEGNVYAGFGPGILQLWKRKSGGGRFSNCMFQKPNGEIIPLPEEEDVFNTLNIKWVDPQDRISRSAIQKL